MSSRRRLALFVLFVSYTTCIQGEENKSIQKTMILGEADSESDELKKSYNNPIWSNLLGICYTFSCICLVFTFLAYVVSKELRSIHVRASLAHTTCLLVTCCDHVVLNLAVDLLSHLACRILAYIWMYTFLASYFWLQIMSFDIWRAFKSPTNAHQMTRETRIFKAYLVYCSVIPTLTLIFGVYFDTYSDIAPESINIFYVNKYWTILIFLSPTVLILITNIYFFVSTALRICRANKEARMTLSTNDTRTHNKLEEQRFKLYMKLFAVTGGPWTFAVFTTLVVFVVDQSTDSNKIITTHFLEFSSLTVSLQGLWIFLVCVWTTKLRQVLLQTILPIQWKKRMVRRQTEKENTGTDKESSRENSGSAVLELSSSTFYLNYYFSPEN